MKFHKQTQFVTKDSRKGNCFPTALACILDLEIDQVPHFNLEYWTQEEEDNCKKVFRHKYLNGKKLYEDHLLQENYDHNLSLFYCHWGNTLNFFLASRGYMHEPIHVDNIKEWCKKHPRTPYLVQGFTKRGTSHIVIYKNGNILHDPHPDNKGLETLKEQPYSYLKKIV